MQKAERYFSLYISSDLAVAAEVVPYSSHHLTSLLMYGNVTYIANDAHGSSHDTKWRAGEEVN